MAATAGSATSAAGTDRRESTRPLTVGRRRRSVVDHGADALPFVHQVEGLVDVLEAHRMRDEGIDLDLALHVLIDHARKLASPLHAAERAAAPHASRHE